MVIGAIGLLCSCAVMLGYLTYSSCYEEYRSVQWKKKYKNTFSDGLIENYQYFSRPLFNYRYCPFNYEQDLKKENIKTSQRLKMVRPGGFEPPASGSGNQHSIQLSYGRISNVVH